MRRPKQILIFGKTIPIEYVSEFEDEATEGMFQSHPLKIMILDNDNWSSRLTHEAVHAALEISGVGQALGDAMEEAVTKCLENALSPYLRFK